MKRKYYVNISYATSIVTSCWTHTYTAHTSTHVNSFEYVHAHNHEIWFEFFWLKFENFDGEIGWWCFTTQMFMLQLFHIAMKLWIQIYIVCKEWPKFICYKATTHENHHHHHQRGRRRWHMNLNHLFLLIQCFSFVLKRTKKIHDSCIGQHETTHCGGGVIKF